MNFRLPPAFVLLSGLTASAATQFPGPYQRLTPHDIRLLKSSGAGDSGISGIRTTLLSGDPERAGLYTIRLSVPADTRIAAHSHRDDRAATVVSGKWYFGYGAKAERARMKELTAGSYYTEPAKVLHFAETRAEPAVLFVTGVGPTDTEYPGGER